MMNEGKIAISFEADKGTVSFSFEMPCNGTVAVWGRVRDVRPGLKDNPDPDSFYVRLDGEPKTLWRYGCQTDGLESIFYWLRVISGPVDEDCDAAVPWTLDLDAGPHTIHLDNRESGTLPLSAVVARVLITTDLNYTPPDSE